jgi:GNAT superfamily N-acetyltransferase
VAIMADWDIRPTWVSDLEAAVELRAVVMRADLAPHLQRSGIGSGVLRQLLESCDRRGVPVRLNVLQGSPARRLYERHRFSVETEDPVDVFMVRKPA